MDKKKVCLKVGLALLLAALVILAGIFAMRFAYRSGIEHVIQDGVFYIVDYEDSASPDYDTTLYIDLDEGEYEAGLYVC